MLEQIRDWFALRGRREHDRTQPTAPADPALTPEEETRAREQLAGEGRDLHDQPRHGGDAEP